MADALIDAAEVHSALEDALYEEDELQTAEELPPPDSVIVEGVVNNFVLHPERLESHRKQVREWLKALDDRFRADEGGGWSFMQMPFDAEYRQWGEQRNAEMLLALALGLDLAEYAMPREAWEMLPGGVPYINIFPDEEQSG